MSYARTAIVIIRHDRRIVKPFFTLLACFSRTVQRVCAMPGGKPRSRRTETAASPL